MNYNGYETSYTSYGSGGGGGGGGGGGDASQQSPSGGRRDYSQDTLRPVTVKQLLGAQYADPTSDNPYKIDGATVTQITFVAQIRNVAATATHTVYKLDDGTGSIEAKLWTDRDADDSNDLAKAKLVEGAYCRAWGKLRSFGDNKKIIFVATIIRPIEDFNEIFCHLLDATTVHLYVTRGPPGGANTGAGAASANEAGQQQAGGGSLGGYDLTGYNKVAVRVLRYLREAPQSNEGLHQQDIAAMLGIDTADIARAGDDLLAGGLIYTTVDDQTWAILEAD
ncbi:hypothetical protein GQ44DRAFT_703403 [Phaeosphaeriaceae sp. PMI808]|nr:hypothetical protein GQ44DRAFT_703403 [Phaeosphaeriaceae sp. PMI808]